MHETVLAQNLLAAILAEAERHDAEPLTVRISCGRLSAVNDEALCFAFEAVAKDTPCQTTKLIIEHKALQATCSRCCDTFDVSLESAACPRCNSTDFQLLPDAPLMLEEIEFNGDQ